jgi:hypothetical protein
MRAIKTLQRFKELLLFKERGTAKSEKFVTKTVRIWSLGLWRKAAKAATEERGVEVAEILDTRIIFRVGSEGGKGKAEERGEKR